jgi:superfamily II DNA or RNA helicase
MTTGSRVIHRSHAEYGFGTIKYDEEDVLGERRLQVIFDHVDTLVEVSPEQVELVGTPLEDAASGKWGDLATLQRRLLTALVISENNATSAFIKTTTRPLPHQVSVLDKILSADRFGHLCADDVGLGKTIEAGFLITSIMTGPRPKRVLVVCPAGVALQWQDEMEEHFSLHFSVLGIDFKGSAAIQWKNHPLIIAPIDRLKLTHFEPVVREAGPFDLVICDEAHRLNASRNRLTKELQKTKSYRLFERLVSEKTIDFVNAAGAPRSPRLIFLSATPHQGDDLRFLYLLNLLRPDLFPVDGEDVSLLQPERLRETVTRTPKAVAHDWEGKPIFKGHTSQTLDVPWIVEETEISRLLTHYIRQSLSSSAASGKPNALVIELVMHTFHKIAASSWRALQTTLEQRVQMLEGARVTAPALEEWVSDPDYEVEVSEEGFEKAFFAQEASTLRKILGQLGNLSRDSKWDRCRELLVSLNNEQPGCKVLFFTQFRATQSYLREQLLTLFPGCGVELVNGDVPLIERRQARKRFESSSRFMVSTEAGGEGVNLQRACHLMVNYDLPWNPMRMQQRIGRLDRYGQRKRVSVFNLRVPESWDARISTRIEERLEVIQKTMGHVVASDIENYREMILGQVAERIEPTNAFREHVHGREIRTEDVDRFLKDAIASMERLKSRVGDSLAPEADPARFKPTLSSEQFRESYAAALRGLKLTLQESRNSQQQFLHGVYHFTLPPEFRDSRIRSSREFYVVFDRELFQKTRDEDLGTVKGQPIKVNLAGFGESFTDWLFQSATSARRDTSAFHLTAPTKWEHGPGWLAVYALRHLGGSRRIYAPDALAVVFIPDTGSPRLLSLKDAFDICAKAVPSTAPRNDVPNLADSANVAKIELKRHVQNRPHQSTASTGMSLWALVRVGVGQISTIPDGNDAFTTFRAKLKSSEGVQIADRLWALVQDSALRKIYLGDLEKVALETSVHVDDVLGLVSLMCADPSAPLQLELRSFTSGKPVKMTEYIKHLSAWQRDGQTSEAEWLKWARNVEVSWMRRAVHAGGLK